MTDTGGLRVLYIALRNAGTCRARRKALETEGLRLDAVYFFDQERVRSSLAASVYARILDGPAVRSFNREILRLAREKRYQWAWVDKGVMVLPRTVRSLAAMGIFVVHHLTDDFNNPRYAWTYRHYRAGIPHYHAHLTSNVYNAVELSRETTGRVIFTRLGFDPDLVRAGGKAPQPREEFRTDVTFVGFRRPHVDEHLAVLLQNDIDFKVWGHGWSRSPLYGEYRRKSPAVPVPDEDYASVYASAKIGLCFLNRENRNTSTARSFEIPAIGTFMLAERTDEHRSLFEEGKEAEFFDSPGEMLEKIRYYLDHEEERERIAAAGHERAVTSGYSYLDVVRKDLENLFPVYEDFLSRVSGSKKTRQGIGLTRGRREPAHPPIYVYRVGQLGDALVALPAVAALKAAAGDRPLVLVTDSPMSRGWVPAAEVFRPTGLFEDVFSYTPLISSRVRAAADLVDLASKIRLSGGGDLVLLVNPGMSKGRMARFRLFFERLCGLRILGVEEALADGNTRDPYGRLSPVTPEHTRLLGIVKKHFPSADAKLPDPAGAIVQAGALEAQRIRESGLIPRTAELVAMGPGSKMPCKRWPLDRFELLGRRLIGSLGLLPVIFGGMEDLSLGDRLVRAWGTGLNLAGKLSVAGAAAVMSKCRAYAGNDTGTMHLAATVGLKCAAIFSARSAPGMWTPVGSGHAILRNRVPCEGCRAEVCPRGDMLCIRSISVDDVTAAVERILGRSSGSGVKGVA